MAACEPQTKPVDPCALKWELPLAGQHPFWPVHLKQLSVALRFDADEHIAARRPAADRLVCAIGKCILFHRQRGPVRGTEVRRKLRGYAPIISSRGLQHQVRSDIQPHDSENGWRNRDDASAKTVNRALVSIIGRVGRHFISDRS